MAAKLIEEAIDRAWEQTKEWTDHEREAYLDSLDQEDHLLFMTPDEAMAEHGHEVAALLDDDFASPEKALEAAKKSKELGSDAFRRGEKLYGNALRHWKQALKALHHAPHTLETDQLRSTVHGNMGAVFMARKQYPAVIGACEAAVEAWSGNKKALYRKTRACIEMGYWDRAISSAKDALEFVEDEKERGVVEKLLEEAERGKSRVERSKLEREEQVSIRRGLAERARALAVERGIRVGPPALGDGDEVRFPVEGEDGHVLWPIRLVFPSARVTEVAARVPEMATIADILMATLEHPAPWDPKHDHAPDSVDVLFQPFIVPPRNIKHAWRDHDEELFRPAEETLQDIEDHDAHWKSGLRARSKTKVDASTWVKLPLHTPLLFLLVQPDFVLADIPILYVVPKDSDTRRAMDADCQGAVPLRKAPKLEEVAKMTESSSSSSS